MADQQTVFRSVSSYPSKIKISFSNGKEPLIEDFGTPEWVSELSTIVDEVRDRTILVKINSPLHSWSDSRISLLFSEIGEVEEVKHLPPGSGFHFQVRFQSSYDSEWAYCYFNGTFLHQGCCELEICRADDLVTWNVQRVVAIKVAFGIRNTPGTKNDDSLLEEVNQIEDTTEVLRKNELDVVKEPSDFSARQVLDKMPKSWLNEIAVINEELVDGIDWEATPMGSVERLDDVKAFKEGKSRDVAHKTHTDKLLEGFHQQEVMLSGVVCVIGFDPGGNGLSDSQEFAQIEKNNQLVVMEFSLLVAHHVFDKIPEPEDCIPEYELKVVAEQDAIEVFKEEMTIVHKGIKSFDPGGLVVSNVIGSLMASAELSFVNGKMFCYAISLLLDLPTLTRTCLLDTFRMISGRFLVLVFDPGGIYPRFSAQAHTHKSYRIIDDASTTLLWIGY